MCPLIQHVHYFERSRSVCSARDISHSAHSISEGDKNPAKMFHHILALQMAYCKKYFGIIFQGLRGIRFSTLLCPHTTHIHCCLHFLRSLASL